MIGNFTDKNGKFRNVLGHGAKLPSKIFNKKNSNKLSKHGKAHLHSFADKAKNYQSNKSIKTNNTTDALNEQVSMIVNDAGGYMSNTDKISQLQRILNQNHKNIDASLLQRIKTELADLHQYNGQSLSEPIEDSVKRENYHRSERGLNQSIEFGQAQHQQELLKLQQQSDFAKHSMDNQEEMNDAELNHYLVSVGQAPNQSKGIKTSDAIRNAFNDELKAQGY